MTTAPELTSDAGLERLLNALEPLGDPHTWRSPTGYPTSLALCLLDSIWSLGSHYDNHVVPVLNRYRTLRAGDASENTATDLVQVIDACRGPVGFAAAVRNRQLTSTTGGVLKAEAVHRAAMLMAEARIETPPQLRQRLDLVKASWRRLPGQRSSATGWRYLLLLAGAAEAKPDRMILKFLTTALGRPCTPDEAHALLVTAASRLRVPLPALDHRIWLVQSGRLPSVPTSA